MSYQVTIMEVYIETKRVADHDDIIISEWRTGCQVLKRRVLSGFIAKAKRTVGDFYEFKIEGDIVRVNKEYCKVRKLEDVEVRTKAAIKKRKKNGKV